MHIPRMQLLHVSHDVISMTLLGHASASMFPNSGARTQSLGQYGARM